MKNKFCLIDLGTNNAIMLLAEVDNAHYKVINRINRISALGEGMKDCLLQTPAIIRLQDIIAEFLHIASDSNAIPIIIGTSALREAKNSHLIQQWLNKKYHLHLKTISGTQEAYYNALANLDQFDYCSMLLFDIGGGSTEFSLIDNNNISSNYSINLGIRRLYNKYADLASAQIVTIRNLIASVNINMPNHTVLINSGETATSLAVILQKIAGSREIPPHKSRITLSQLDNLINFINDSDDNTISELSPANPLNKTLILTAAIITREIIARFNALDFFVSDRTWQFGVLMEIIAGRFDYE